MLSELGCAAEQELQEGGLANQTQRSPYVSPGSCSGPAMQQLLDSWQPPMLAGGQKLHVAFRSS